MKRKNNISLFVEIGIIVLRMLMIIGLVLKILPDAITVSNISSKRDLPIYCVDCEEKRWNLALMQPGEWLVRLKNKKRKSACQD